MASLVNSAPPEVLHEILKQLALPDLVNTVQLCRSLWQVPDEKMYERACVMAGFNLFPELVKHVKEPNAKAWRTEATAKKSIKIDSWSRLASTLVSHGKRCSLPACNAFLSSRPEPAKGTSKKMAAPCILKSADIETVEESPAVKLDLDDVHIDNKFAGWDGVKLRGAGEEIGAARVPKALSHVGFLAGHATTPAIDRLGVHHAGTDTFFDVKLANGITRAHVIDELLMDIASYCAEMACKKVDRLGSKGYSQQYYDSISNSVYENAWTKSLQEKIGGWLYGIHPYRTIRANRFSCFTLKREGGVFIVRGKFVK